MSVLITDEQCRIIWAAWQQLCSKLDENNPVEQLMERIHLNVQGDDELSKEQLEQLVSA